MSSENNSGSVATVAVVDYEMGNLRSVAQALVHAAQDEYAIVIAQQPEQIAQAERVVTTVSDCAPGGPANAKRPLLVLLDATWPEARKMFRKSPYLNHLPVLSLAPEQVSRYVLRRSRRGDHFCTAEVAALCLELTGDSHAAQTLDAYLDVFSHHYLQAKHQLPPQWEGEAHQRLQALARGA